MPAKIYLGNVNPSLGKEEVMNFLAPLREWGEVHSLEVVWNHKTGKAREAYHFMLEADNVTVERLDSYNVNQQLGGRYVYFTLVAKNPSSPLNHEEKAFIRSLCESLGETEKQPYTHLVRLLRTCGPNFMRGVLSEAEAVHAAGGMLTADNSRPRTKGGIFFHLARQRMSPYLIRAVFSPQDAPGSNNSNALSPHKVQARPIASAKPTQEKAHTQAIKTEQRLPDVEELRQAEAQLHQLQRAYEQAQAQLEALKHMPPQARQAGLFSATREVANLQKKIAMLLKTYPSLTKS
jgi:hypothetical protein